MDHTVLRKATIADIEDICTFTDFWLAGRGMKVEAPGAVNDYFISPAQHKRYITKYQTHLITLKKEIIAWSVIQADGSMIHLLVSGYYRGFGLGTQLIKELTPRKIHSKIDQSSGDPAAFYEKLGYIKTTTVKSHSRIDIDEIKPNRKKNIDIFEQKTGYL